MYLFRGMMGFSWYTKVVSKDLNTNAQREGYINFTFKKGCEPTQEELNDKNAYAGDLYFHDTYGRVRKVFPVVTEFNGNKRVEFKLLEIEGQPVQTKTREQSNNGGGYAEIKSEDLPFY